MGCERDDCSRPHYAKGVCSTHYRADRRAAGIDAPRSRYAEDRACDTCRETYTARFAEQRYCDRMCRDLANIIAGQQVSAGALGVAAREAATSCEISFGTCLHCDGLMVIRSGRPKLYCKPSHWHAAHKRDRAHRKHAELVHQRDAWTCWLCGDPTSREWTASDPLAPTLDHLIPRSIGGSDEPDNLGTAHAICNSLRGARMVHHITLSPAA